MRLLIVTQRVDRRDPILGFFHRWIEEFSKNCESVIVVGQYVGDHALPKNVTVLSLGKEKGAARLMQIPRFRWLLWKHRREYDAIFVHMTPIWAVIAWGDSVLLRKPVYLWYEARGARWPLRVAVMLVRKVFSASSAGMPLKTAKSVITGHGIDTALFSPGSGERNKEMLLTVSRITASKRLPVLLRMLARLPSSYRLMIMGIPLTQDDRRELAELQELIRTLDLTGRVECNSHPPEGMPAVLQFAGCFVHASATSLDKALLEAMACGCLVVSCADAAHGVLPKECLASPEGMDERVKTLLGLPAAEQDALRHQLRDIVIRGHSLDRLIGRLVKEMM